MPYDRKKPHKKSNRSKEREEFIKLQNIWYEKLAKSGFSDLEWLDKNSGKGQNSPFLRQKLQKFKHLSASELSNRAKFFIGALQFSQDYKFPSRLHKYVWQLYSEGISYRDMIPLIRRRNFKHVPSIHWISIHLDRLRQAYEAWQLSQPDDLPTTADLMKANDCCF